MKFQDLLAKNLFVGSECPVATHTDAQLAGVLVNAVLNTQTHPRLFTGQYDDMEMACMNLLKGVVERSTTMEKSSVNEALHPVYKGFLPTTQMLFTQMPNAQQFNTYFVTQAKRRMESLYSWSVPKDEFDDLAAANSCAVQTFEYLNRAVGLYFVKKINGEEVTRKRTLVTRNLYIIQAMQEAGMLDLESQQTIMEMQSKLQNTNQMFGKQSGEAWVVHLQCVGGLPLNKGTEAYVAPKYHVTFSRGKIKMAYSKTTDKKGTQTESYIIPLQAVYAEETFLKSLMYNGYYRVIKESNDGLHERIVTTNPKGVAELYGSAISDEDLRVLFGEGSPDTPKGLNNGVTSGFSIATLRHYFVDVEASASSTMVWSVQPGAWAAIEQVDPKVIDKSCHNLDIRALVGVVTTRATVARTEQFNCLAGVIDMSACTCNRERVDAVLTACDGLKPMDLYKFVKDPAYEPFFGDIERLLQMRVMHRRKYLKNFKPVTLQRMNTDADTIRNLLKTGVVALTISSRTKGVYSVMGTTNPTILANTYGKDWLLRYGAPRAKLKELQEKIRATNAPLDFDTVVEYNLVEKLPENFGRMTAAEQIDAISSAILILQQKDLDIQPGTIYFNVADAFNVVDSKGKVSIYRMCNAANIMSAKYAPAITE